MRLILSIIFLYGFQLFAQEVKLGMPVGHTEIVYTAEFSPDGKTILTASKDKTAKLWNIEGALLQSFEGHTGLINSAVFSPDGKSILTSSFDFTAKLWNIDGTQMQSFEGHTYYVTSARFSPNGEKVVTSSNDGTSKVWDTKTGKLELTLDSSQTWIECAVFSDDGKLIATASDNGEINIWSTISGHRITELKCTNGNSQIQFSSDCTKLHVRTYTGIQIWNLLNSELISEIELPKDISDCAIYSSDEKNIVFSVGKDIKIWEVESNTITCELRGHELQVTDITISSDGKKMTSPRKTGRIETLEIGKCITSNKYRFCHEKIKIYGSSDFLCD